MKSVLEETTEPLLVVTLTRAEAAVIEACVDFATNDYDAVKKQSPAATSQFENAGQLWEDVAIALLQPYDRD